MTQITTSFDNEVLGYSSWFEKSKKGDERHVWLSFCFEPLGNSSAKPIASFGEEKS